MTPELAGNLNIQLSNPHVFRAIEEYVEYRRQEIFKQFTSVKTLEELSAYQGALRELEKLRKLKKTISDVLDQAKR